MIWVWYALLSALSASFVTIFVKIGLKDSDPILTALVRSVIATVFLFIVSVSFRKPFQYPLQLFTYQNLLFIALSGIAGGISWIFYLTALKYGPTSPVAMLDRLSLVFTIILSVLVLGEYIHLKHVIGAVLIMLGAYIVAA